MKTGVIIGAALIGAAYLYMRKSPGGAAGNLPLTHPDQFRTSGSNPLYPSRGWGYDPANPGDLILSKDLINGTISDYSARDVSGYLMPSIDDLVSNVVRDWYGNTAVKPVSVVSNPGALW